MAYEYEDRLKNRLLDLEFDTWEETTQFEREYRELERVYRKAKAFDEILKIDNQATDEDRVTGQYESDIETVISEHMESADDER